MVENEGAIWKQVKQLKEEIRAARSVQNRLGNQDMSREQLLTFDMLERHPLVTDQVAYEFRLGPGGRFVRVCLQASCLDRGR